MNVKILYLYPDFMNLYGDNGNVRIMEKRLKDQGFDVEIVRSTVTDHSIDFEGADFIYMGSGFESNRNAALKHLSGFRDSLVKAIEDGVPMLFTGNSYDMLGKGITAPDGTFIEGLGIFNFTFKEQLEKRYTGDVVLEDKATGERYAGFVNRAGVQDSEEDLVFDAIKVIGNIPIKKDAVIRNNLTGISLIGPVLLKNPKMADKIVNVICERKGVQVKPVNYPLSEKSHDKTLKALMEAEL